MTYISDMFILLLFFVFFLIVEFAYLCKGKMEILYDD